MNHETRDLIREFSPMLTNREVWEFDQLNESITFDLQYVKPGNPDPSTWSVKMAYPDSKIRDAVVRTFDHLAEGNELLISSRGEKKVQKQLVPYLMAVMADVMIDEEICLNFRLIEERLGVTIDRDADVIDCKEFFEEFYHLATGFNFDIDTGIPEDETEAELYLTRLQQDFDEKMREKLRERYISGNSDPDSIQSNN